VCICRLALNTSCFALAYVGRGFQGILSDLITGAFLQRAAGAVASCSREGCSVIANENAPQWLPGGGC
jgi:hypothetical protein